MFREMIEEHPGQNILPRISILTIFKCSRVRVVKNERDSSAVFLLIFLMFILSIDQYEMFK